MEAKTAIWVMADLVRSSIDTASRMAEPLAGIPVLTRTVRRILKAADSFDCVVVFCSANQQAAVQALLPTDERVVVKPLSEPFGRGAVRFRKWSLESWRGGLAEMTWFDECQVSREMIKFGIENKHHVVMVCPGDAPVLDPTLIQQVLAHYDSVKDAMRFVFCQAPPGICGCVYRLDMLHEIEQAGMTVGNLLAYNPDMPHSDQIVHECTYKVPKKVYYSFSRFLADNQRSWRMLDSILSEHSEESLDAGRLVELAGQWNQLREFPKEIEIEVNSQCSLRYKGYPHTQADRDGWRRGDMALADFENIVKKCAEFDDICLTIGGFGEPLAHPDIVEMVKTARHAGIFGINIETDGLRLDAAMTDALIAAGVDVVTVWVDAWTAETYARVKPVGGDFGRVVANIEYFISKSAGTGAMVIPAMTKTAATMADMEDFYDQWRRKRTLSIVTGHNSYCGRITDENVMNMCPPARHVCHQLGRNMMILSDGRAVLCCQDYAGNVVLGDAMRQDLIALWNSSDVNAVIAAQREGVFDNNNLCRACRHWFR